MSRFLSRSMPEKELVESSYKLTMVLTVIDRLFLIVPDNKIKNLNKQVRECQ